MVRYSGTGQSSPKSNGINESRVALACVYAGSFWTLQQPCCLTLHVINAVNF